MSVSPRARRIALPDRGGEIAALEFGPQDRPVDVVFSHANGFSAGTYARVLAPLEDLRILAIDQRGHGATSLPTEMEGRVSWDDMVEDLAAVATRLDLRNVVLAGHSLGAAVSLMAAPRIADRVRAVVLFDPVVPSRRMLEERRVMGHETASPMVAAASRRRATFESRDAAFASYQGRGAFKTWPDEILRDYVETGFRDTADGDVTLACAPAWEACNFAAQANDPWSAFQTTTCPIRIIRAETGTTCRIDDDMDELRANSRIEIQTVPGTTHFMPMERPELVRTEFRRAAN